jgi:predicted ArsR family transcriptional regulator
MPKETTVRKDILKFLAKQEWPSTTEDTAASVGVSWQTAQVHLLKLATEGIVKYRKVGRQNQFWLSSKYRKEFET